MPLSDGLPPSKQTADGIWVRNVIDEIDRLGPGEFAEDVEFSDRHQLLYFRQHGIMLDRYVRWCGHICGAYLLSGTNKEQFFDSNGCLWVLWGPHWDYLVNVFTPWLRQKRLEANAKKEEKERANEAAEQHRLQNSVRSWLGERR